MRIRDTDNMAPNMWLRDESAAPTRNTSTGLSGPPPLPQYNLSDNMAPSILTFTGIVTALALVIVVLRVYIRRFVLKSLGADDIVISLAMLVAIVNYVCFIGETTHGLGRHITAIGPEDMLQLSKWQFMHSWLVLLCASLVKISICLLLLRLVTRPIYRWSLWGIGIFIAVYNTICIFTIIFACIPVAANWDYSLMTTAKCFSMSTYRGLGILNSAVSMFTDVLLVILPMPIIYHLQIERRAKLVLIAIMSLGLIAVGAGAAKTAAQFNFLADPDRFYHDRFFVWAAVESCFGMMCASTPTLRPLLSSCGGVLRRTYNSSSLSRRRTSPSDSAATSQGSTGKTETDLEKAPGPVVSVDEIHPDSPRSKDSRSSVLSGLYQKDVTRDQDAVQMTPLSGSPTSGILRTKNIITTSEPIGAGLTAAFPVHEPMVKTLKRHGSSRTFNLHRSSREPEIDRLALRSVTATPEPVYLDSSSERELINGRA